MADRRYCALIALATACLAVAAHGAGPPTPAEARNGQAAIPPVVDTARVRNEATAAAHRLGGEGNLAALHKLLDLHDEPLLDAYARGLVEAKPPVLSDDIERIVAENVGKRKVLLQIPARVRYRSRALLDAILDAVRSSRYANDGSTQYQVVQALVHSDANGTADALFSLVQSDCGPGRTATPRPRVSSGDCKTLFTFLESQPYPPFDAWALGQMQNATPMDDFSVAAIDLLVATRPADSVDPLVARLRTLAQRGDAPEARRESALILGKLGQLDASVPIDYSRLRSVLSPEQREANRGALYQIVVKRRDERGIPDLLDFLASRDANDRVPFDVANAILAWPSPALWRDALATIERLQAQGRIDEKRIGYQRSQLSRYVANSDQRLAELHGQERAVEYHKALQGIGAIKTAANKLKQSDPARYSDEILRYCTEFERINREFADLRAPMLRWNDLATEYASLATYHRFARHDPQKAIALYRKAAGFPLSGQDVNFPALFPATLIADTLQFDVKDKAGAAAQYRAAADAVRAQRAQVQDDYRQMLDWWIDWLDYEARFLTNGKRYSGHAGKREANAFFVMASFTTMAPWSVTDPTALAAIQRPGNDVDAKAIDALFAQAPASRTTLAATLMLLARLPDAKSVLRHLARNDPSGYWTASIFAARAALEAREHARNGEAAAGDMLFGAGLADSQVMREAARLYASTGGARIAIEPPDRRKSSPEATWQLMIASLRKGDAATALDCFSGPGRDTVNALFPRLSKQALAEIADSFVAFSMSMRTEEIAEAIIVRQSHGEKRAGAVDFARIEGEWRIVGM